MRVAVIYIYRSEILIKTIEMEKKMSLLKYFMMILFAGVLVTSCDKDDDDEPADLLVGTWTAQSADAEARVGNQPMADYFVSQGFTVSDAQLLTNLFNVTIQQSFTGTITFIADGTYTSTLGGESDAGTWSLSADGKQLTIDSNTDNTLLLNVDRLTGNELVVSWTETGEEDLNDDTVPETIVVDVTMNLTK